MKHLPMAAAPRPRVRVVLPSGALRSSDLPAFEDGLTRLNRAGFEVRFDPNRADARWRDYYAGTDGERADEFIAALQEPNIDIVWWGRGGAGCARLLPRLLDVAQHLPPRILIGFSDATAVLNAFAAQLGWITFHGPAITSIARTDLDRLRAVVCGKIRTVPVLGGGRGDSTTPNLLEGRLFGGNLTVLTTLLGTAWQPPCAQTIWMLEEVNEATYRIDRALRHLRDAGATKGAAGVWYGPLHAASTDSTHPSMTRLEDDLALPCLPGFPGGHSGEMHLVPIGAHVRIDSRAGHLVGAHPWVRARSSGQRLV